MKRSHGFQSLYALLAAFFLAIAFTVYAQDQTKPNTAQVPPSHKLTIDGLILEHQADSITVRSTQGAIYNVTTENAEVKEKKINPFRGSKKYSRMELVPGLQVEVKGIGSKSGSLSAREIRCTDDDFKMAQTMDSRVVPVENRLTATQARLSETEQNAKRLSGQVNELSAVSNAARSGAKAAQETADNAMSTANNAKSLADDARAGVRAVNERITSLDDYDVKQTATVHFKIDSATLSKADIEELEKLAAAAKGEKGFVIEVAGFASSDGDQAYNRRLSQRRADVVIQYIAENYSIPLRRFVTPMGYGESQPVADNHTRTGRQENRRVEVRIFVSKGITAPPIQGSLKDLTAPVVAQQH